MSAWAIPTLLSILLLAGLLAFVLWHHPPPRTFSALVAGQLSALAFAVGDLVTMLARDPVTHAIGLTFIYGGIMAVGPAWFLLSLHFADHQGVPLRLTRSPWRFAPAVAAGLLFVGFATNPWHGQFLTPYVDARNEYHALWWIHAGVAYAVLLGGVAIYLTIARRGADATTRSRGLIMAGATAGPVIGNATYVFSPTPLPFDPSSVGLCFACALMIVGIYRRQLFALSPIALTQILQRDPDGVVLLDHRGRTLYANPAAERLLADAGLRAGSPTLTALAGALRDPRQPDQPLEVDALGSAIAEAAASPEGPLFRYGPRGERWLRIVPTPIPARRRSRAGYSLRLRDETRLQAAMDAVENQASVLRATLAATNEGLLVGTPGGAIRYFNNRWREIIGLPDSIQPGDHVDCMRDHVVEMLADWRTVDHQVELAKAEPSRKTLDEFELLDGRVIESASQPLMRDGEITGRVWRLRDITEQRRSEAAVRHAQKLESLGVMAGGIAHDFNNLLAVIMGNASLAREEMEPGGIAAACLEDVTKAAERAGDLTEQLLAYAGKSDLVLEELDVSRVIREVADLISLSIPKGVGVHYALGESLPAVMGDASQLRQIAMNLVMNGAESIDEEGGTVLVETRQVTPGREKLLEEQFGALNPGPKLMLRVSDSGGGMDEFTRSRIFDPFFSTKFAGRGLGLAATLGIVRSHRGTLHVESAPGVGSVFTVLLPCLETPVRPEAGGEPPSAWLGEGTILIVDDDDAVRIAASRILRSTGLSVIAAADGAEAVRLYQERGHAIDAVLLDVTMPQMSGERAWRALRSLDPEARVILSSGYPESEAIRTLSGEKDVFFVRKPYEKRTLVQRVREVLGR